MMRVFVSTDFEGHWPVGTSAIVVAPNKNSAVSLLSKAIRAAGLPGDPKQFTVREIKLDTAKAEVLQDGNY